MAEMDPAGSFLVESESRAVVYVDVRVTSCTADDILRMCIVRRSYVKEEVFEGFNEIAYLLHSLTTKLAL